MSVDFRRAGLLKREAMLLIERPGGGEGGRVVFLDANLTSDRMHRMDLAKLRRFSVTRESKAVKLTLLMVPAVLLLLALAGVLAAGGPDRWFGLVAVLVPLAVLVGGLVVAVLQQRVRLGFEDATRTREFRAWTWGGKLRRFEERLDRAVAEAQAD